MTPVADSANPPVQLEVAAAEELLDGGEVILLAIRPSPWFVLLTCWPVLAAAGVVSGVTVLAAEVMGVALPGRSIYFVCGAVASIRVAFACGEWVGRLYILTSRRVLCVQGVRRARIEGCPLQKIVEMSVVSSPGERPLGVGSLVFMDGAEKPLGLVWACLARPAEVREAVEAAIRRVR